MAGLVGKAFIPYYDHLMDLLSTNPDLKKSAKGIFKQVAYGAGGTAIGGVFGGPLGALVGVIVGAVIGYCLSDDYEAMIKVLADLSDSEKKRLVQKVQKLVRSSLKEDLTKYIGSQAQRKDLLHLVRVFSKNPQGR